MRLWLLALVPLILAGEAECRELDDGLYHPSDGNNASICPQQVKTFHSDEGELTAIEVVYVGDCYYQGPYLYYCARGDEDVRLSCQWGNELFEIRDRQHYLWRNLAHDIWGDFEWKEKGNGKGGPRRGAAAHAGSVGRGR